MQSRPTQSFQSLVIEAWIPEQCVLTPSLILHNLDLQCIKPINDDSELMVCIDRGHYDCAGTNYAVILVEAQLQAPAEGPRHSFYCSLFSRRVTLDMDNNAEMHSHWLGNCYVHLGHTVALCSHRHESGHAKTWRRIDQSDAVSVDPVPVQQIPIPKKKNNLRIIQLQKKNLLLRTEVDVLKAEFRDLKAELAAVKEGLGTVKEGLGTVKEGLGTVKEDLGTVKEDLGTVKEDQVGLAQRYKQQEATTQRANQCMRDWINLQVIERVCILEAQQSECKSFHKKNKKALKRLSDRLVLLENVNISESACNKCCSGNDPVYWNPFDFKTICDPLPCLDDDDECPALDLIVNHYPDVVNNCDDDDDDDDLFEIVQVFDLPSK
jgi:hypothetical protein